MLICVTYFNSVPGPERVTGMLDAHAQLNMQSPVYAQVKLLSTQQWT